MRHVAFRPRSCVFGAILMHDFDLRKGGKAWRGRGRRSAMHVESESIEADIETDAKEEDSYRTRTGYHIRTQQRVSKELEAAGYIQVTHGRGRGHSNSYWPILEKATDGPHFLAQKAAHQSPISLERVVGRPPFEAERAVAGTIKGGPPTTRLLEDSITKNAHARFGDRASTVAAMVEAEGLAGGKRTACAGARFQDANAAIEAVIAAGRLSRDDVAILRAFRFDPAAQMLIAGTLTALIAIRERAGSALSDWACARPGRSSDDRHNPRLCQRRLRRSGGALGDRRESDPQRIERCAARRTSCTAAGDHGAAGVGVGSGQRRRSAINGGFCHWFIFKEDRRFTRRQRADRPPRPLTRQKDRPRNPRRSRRRASPRLAAAQVLP